MRYSPPAVGGVVGVGAVVVVASPGGVGGGWINHV